MEEDAEIMVYGEEDVNVNLCNENDEVIVDQNEEQKDRGIWYTVFKILYLSNIDIYFTLM